MAVYLDKKTNKWYASITYYENSVIRHTTIRGFNLKKEAARFESEFRHNLDFQEHISEVICFKDALKSYLFDKKSSRKKSTYDEINRISKTYFISLYDINVEKLRTPHYQDIKNSLVNKELSVSYKNKILSLMKSISRYISGHYETFDYAKIITRFVDHSIKEVNPTWTPKELKLFLSVVDREMYKDFFQFLYYTGLRLGEARALYKTDYDNNILNVNKSIRRNIEGVTSTKNKYSVRRIGLDKNTNDFVKHYASTKGIYLFRDNAPLSQSNVNRVFNKYIMKVSELNPEFKKIRVHDLRHSHATLLINKGANIVAVSKRLGHSSVQQTLKTYTHLFKENEDALISILNKN